MRVFVTGATGFIGSAVIPELLQAGHRVLGLARSDAAAQSLLAMGAEVHRGGLEDLESLRSGAAICDGVIHTAFIHDFSKYKESCETDRKVIEALGSGLEGSDRPLIVTSATSVLKPGRLATEEDAAAGSSTTVPRAASEEAADSTAARGVRAAIVRLPLTVHGDGDHAFVPLLISTAREKGVSAYVGSGHNRWPAVHRLDAAHLYRLAVENGFAAGSRFHCVADEGVPVREIAEVIGRRLNVPVVGKPAEEAGGHFGWMAYFLGMDCPASSEKTQERLGWRPTHASLIQDLDGPTYFAS